MIYVLNNILLICFVRTLTIACYEIYGSVVCGFYSVALCTAAVPSKNDFCAAAFANVFEDFFSCVFVVARFLSVFMLSLRC